MTQKQEASQINFDSLFKNHPQPMWIYDFQSLTFLEVNTAGLKKYGYSRKKFLSMTIKDIRLKGKNGGLKKKTSSKSQSFQQINKGEHKLKSGKIINVEITAHDLKYNGRKAILETSRDITDELLAEEKLKLTQFGIDQAQVSVFQIGDEGKIYYANEQASKSLGYTSDELTSMNIVDIDTSITLSDWKKHRKNISKTRSSVIETTHKRKDGTKFFVEVTISLIEFAGKKRSFSFAKDITERRRAEDALRDSEQRFQVLAENSPVGIFQTDAKGSTIYVNSRWCQISGLSATEAIGTGWLNAVHNDDKQKLSNGWEKATQKNNSSQAEYRFVHKDGTIVWVIGEAIPERNANKKIIGYIGTIVDITERKLAEQKIQVSEKQLRTLVEGTKALLFTTDHRGRFTFLNQAASEILNIPTDQLLGSFYLHLIHPDDRKRVHHQYLHQLKHSVESTYVEFRYIGKKNKSGWFSFFVNPIVKNGKAIGLSGVAQDITERKLAEAALHETEEIFKHFMEHSPIYVFFKDENIRSLRLSKNYETMLGKPVQELLGKNMFDLFPSELATSMVDDDKRILKEGKEITIEEELNGRFYSTIKFPIFIDKKPSYLAGYTIDITERKSSEEALKQANLVVENSPAVLFRWKARKGWPVSFVSRNVVQFGYSPDELLNGSTPYASIVYPEDLERVSHEVDSKAKLGIDRFQQEYRILRKDGSICWVDDRTMVERNIEGQVTHYQGIVVDITERKRTEETLLMKNYAVASSMNGIGITDLKGVVIYVNDAAVKMWGYKSQDEILGRLLPDFWAGDGIYPTLKALEKEGSRFGEDIGKRKDNSLFHMQFSASVVKDNDGIPKYIFGSFIDITERKQIEAALKESENKFRTVVEEAVEIVFTVDNNGYFTYVNPAGIKSSGYSSDELKKLKYIDLIEPEHKLRVNLNYFRQFKERKPLTTTEYPFRTKSGEVKWFNQNARLIIENDRVAGFYVIARDVTERRKVEEALQENTFKLRNIFEHSTNLFYSHDINHVLNYMSPQVKNILGYEVEEALIKWTEYASDNPINEIGFQKTIKAIETGVAQEPYELELVHKNGSKVWVEVREAPVVENGNTIAIVGSLDDITERKRAEETLTKSEKKYYDIFKYAPTGIYQSTRDDCFISVNDKLTMILGYDSTDELLRQKISRDVYFDAQERQKLIEKFEALGSVFNHEVLWKKKNSDPIWISLTSHAVKDESMGTLYFEGFVEDITERKLIEEALKESENKFRSVIEEAVEIVFTVDNRGYFTYVNPAGIKSSGYSLEELTKLKYLDLVEPNYKQKAKLNYLRQYKERISVTTEDYPFCTKSGEIKWFNQNVRLILENDDVKGFYAISRDITEQRKAEEALRENEEKFRSLVESINEVFYIADKDGKITYCSPNITPATGFELNEILGNSFLRMIAPIDRRSVMNHYLDMTKKTESDTMQVFRVRCKDGKIIWAEQITHIVRDLNGNVVEYRNVTRNITDRKIAEGELNKLSSAVEQSPVSVIITNKDGNIEYVNKKFCAATGYSKQEVLGKNPRILNSGYHDKKFYADLWNTIIDGNNWQGEMRNKKRTGELFWESALISPLVDYAGEITNYIAVKEDITEKKLLMEELIEAKDKAESSNKLKDAFIANMSHEIRTPLNGILGLTSVIKSLYADHIKEDEESIFSGIDHSSKRIIRTVDMILNYSRVQTGEFPIKPLDIELSVICENLVKEFAVTAKSKLLELSFENRCGNSTTIFGDEYSVTHSISNLIDNAIKYTENGFIKIILYKGSDNEILLEIKDSGIGIGKEYLSHIFEPYQQEHLGYGRAYEGVGLGLSMVKKFLSLNKADICVESEKGNRYYIYYKFR